MYPRVFWPFFLPRILTLFSNVPAIGSDAVCRLGNIGLLLIKIIQTVEFIVWYLKGFQAFDQFSRDRATEDTSLIKEDVYFKLVKMAQGNDREILTAAVFKKAVASVSQMSNDYFPQRATLTMSPAI